MSEVLAGKIGVTNGGEWNAETYYEEATFVRHQNNLYLSNLPSTGIEPTNEEYWMLAMEGFSGDDVQTLIDSINNIINGTTQVGNAKTLDGHEAEDFAGVAELFSTVRSYKNLDFNNAVSTGIYVAEAKPSSEGASNYPIDLTGNLVVFGGNTVSQRYATHTGIVYERSYYAGLGWTGWKEVLTTAGGTVIGEDAFPLSLKSNSGGTVLTKHINAHGVILGSLGFSGVDNPVFKTSDGNTNNTLLHTGNKPSGSYTGNGSATSRTVNVGGVGKALLISNSIKGIAIVTSDGAFGVGADGNPVHIPSEECKFVSGVLTAATTNALVNADSYGYKYISI